MRSPLQCSIINLAILSAETPYLRNDSRDHSLTVFCLHESQALKVLAAHDRIDSLDRSLASCVLDA